MFLANGVGFSQPGDDYLAAINNVFNKHGLTGTMIIYDPARNHYSGYNPAGWDSGYLPASTFKIPNTLIGLETGVIKPGHIFRWNGEPRRLPQWEQDLSLQDAFRVSCVPCYQEIARLTGPERMKSWLSLLNYPGMDVRSENIDLFWLEGNSRITPRQQLEFLKQLYEEKLPLKTTVMQTLKAMMVNEVTPGYTLSGKTGWAIRNGNNYGWFVGWVETQGKVFYVATLVEPKNQTATVDFASARKQVTMEVLASTGKIPPSLDSLLWMLGSWEMNTGKGTFTETWRRINDTLFQGESRMIKDNDTLFSERISLVQRGTELFYIPEVSNQNDGKPVRFRLISTAHGQWIFENPDHDFPQQIIYSQPYPGSMEAVVAGTGQGKPREEVFRMTSVTP